MKGKKKPDAFEERKAREAKQLERVGFRKISIEEHERLKRLDLERQADDILKADIQGIAANVQMLCENFASLQQPSNDPVYLARILASEATRNAIANKTKLIHVVPDKAGTWIGVELQDPKHHADALEVARQMGQHFEAPIKSHEKEGA